MAWTEKYADGYRGRYKDRYGRNRTAGAHKKKSEALRMAQREELKIADGIWVDPEHGKVTLDDYFHNLWLPNVMLEEQTKISYESSYKVHIGPTFGQMEIRKIRASQVQGWVTRMHKAGAQPSTVKKRFAHLQSILGGQRGISAMTDRLIDHNPCQGVRLPPVPKRKVAIYNPQQVDHLMDAVDPWWRPLILLWSDTGMRWSELMGLRVQDWSLGMRNVTVNRTVCESTKTRLGKEHPFYWKDYPKDVDARVLAVTRAVGQLVAEVIAQRGLRAGDRLFSMPAKREYGTQRVLEHAPLRTEEWPEGLPVGKGYFRKCVWIRAVEAADLPYRRPYDMRATNISWLLNGGAPLPVVMERAGHNKTETTMKYTTSLDSDTQALDALARTRAEGIQGKDKKKAKKKRAS
jgi:integrase